MSLVGQVVSGLKEEEASLELEPLEEQRDVIYSALERQHCFSRRAIVARPDESITMTNQSLSLEIKAEAKGCAQPLS